MDVTTPKTTFYKQFPSGTQQISITSEEGIKYQGGTTEDPFKGTLASGWSLNKPAVPESNLFNTKSSSGIVSGSEDVRADSNQVKTDSFDISKEIANFDTQTTIDDIKIQTGWRDPNAELTTDEQKRVDEEAQLAGAEYDDLIATAEQAKQEGLPKAIIGAGERGGFMSTQFAGAAALTQTQGGTFIGAGGELENIKSAYDRNIQSMKSAQQRAIQAARQAAEQAIRTGKREDNKAAQDLFKLAQDANIKAINLAQAKVDLVNSYEKGQQAKIEFGQEQEDRAIESVASTVISQLGDDNDTNVKLIQQIATENNVDPNRLLEYVNNKMKEDMFFKSSDFISIMKDLPAGQTQDITDPFSGNVYTIEGMGTTAPNIITATTTNDKGDVLTIARDKNTGEEIWRNVETGVGKTKTQASNVTINAAGARTPVYVGGKQVGYQSYNDKTGKTSFVSISSEYKSDENGVLPEGATLGTFAAGNPDEENQLISQIELILGKEEGLTSQEKFFLGEEEFLFGK